MCGYRTTIYLPRSHLRQKVGSYDYTDTKPTERTRPPQPLAKQKIQINGMTLERGVCGGIINSSLAVESISLDHDSYDMGDEFSYVLVLRAVYPTRVPIRASLAEIEPKDPKMSYEWRRLSFALDLHSPSHKTIVVGLLSLVGSKEVQGTEIELKSGEWIELRGEAKMEWSNPSAGMLMPEDENGSFGFSCNMLRTLKQWFLGVVAKATFSTRRRDKRREYVTRQDKPMGERPWNSPSIQK
jgi:hypothetical protein